MRKESVPEVQQGGHTNAGAVIRHGDAVHRPASRNSDVIASLLRHVRQAGFTGVPEYRGADDAGRDVFTWLDGVTYSRALPDWITTPKILGAVARLVRDFHDAAADFVDPRPWTPRLPAPPELAGSRVCHGDLGFGNVIFVGQDPVALIDFDFIVRADPLLDVASIASQWTPVPRSSDEEVTQRRNAVLSGAAAIARGFGLSAAERCRLPEAMRLVEDRALDYVRSDAAEGFDAAVRKRLIERREFRLAWLAKHRTEITGALAVEQ